ncbi:FliH/SctL family protein [Sneathiella sp.]|uniref:FliH/SctL family protein n=1 Tax=Sneathiella sp. TaxID=1964365 RepID=UPI0025CF856D|nr:FliH/SctL family protein [Sneathiella sp.]
MSSTTRFLFDTEFGASSTRKKAEAQPAEREKPVYTESDVAALKAEAFENGVRQGQGQSLQGVESAISDTMTAINNQLGQLLGNYEAKVAGVKQDAANLALAIASKLAPALIDLAPEAEVRKLIEESLMDLQDEPRVVIRASEATCQNISGKIEEITLATGFQGKLILLPDDSKNGGDCRIEWADGGTERRLEDIQQRLESAINRFIRSTGTTNDEKNSYSDQPAADQF